MPLGMLALLAAAAAPCEAALCQAESLESYFEKLAHAGDHTPGRKPVHILQIGDSHTAGDAITGGWRDLLQAQYGSGGRGVMAAGRPYQGYVTYGATASMSPDWTVKSIFGGASVPPRPLIGLSGFSVSTAQAGATLGFTADPNEAFNRFTVCALTQPGAGKLSIRVGFTVEEFNLSSFATRSECRTIETPETQLSAQIVANDGPVTITSWGAFRDAGGVVLSNVGVSGSQFVHQARADDSVISEELRQYKPDLVVIAFGTNEGFAPRVEAGQYEIVLRSQLARIRRLVRNVPILMLGTPDANTRNAALFNNAVGVAVDCNTTRSQTIDDIMATLRASEAAGEGAQTPAQPETDPTGRPLFAPPGLAVIREVQRRVAAELNIAFWDWQARMGGACSAARLVKTSPPLMRGDFVHYNKAGGWEIARMLQADLSAAASSVTASR
jgi:lysophospholipase L1-like esterase